MVVILLGGGTINTPWDEGRGVDSLDPDTHSQEIDICWEGHHSRGRCG